MHLRFLIASLLLALTSCGEIILSDPSSDSTKNESSTSGGSSSDSGSSDSTESTLPAEVAYVDAFPSPCSIWQNHIVALVQPIQRAPVPEASASGNTPAPTEAIITLISLYDWAELPSALNESDPTLALAIAQGYQEYDLTDWRIPTTAEAKALRAAYPAPVPEDSSSDITSLNALLQQVEALPLNPSARYLCDEGSRSFSFAPGTTISAAGTKATTYRLRLVRTLRLKEVR